MNLPTALFRSAAVVSFLAGALFFGAGAGCGGVATVDPDDEGDGTQVVSAYEPPTTYMCQQQVPQGACASCLEQSASGACGTLRDQCDASADCVSFGECQFDCSKEVGCCQACSADNPSGFVAYAEYVECAVCDECATACQGLFPELCGA